ncbi:hypothetical protein [Leptospira sp. mild_001]|uniref:hypothetical protein n=1 Tax=Leptospira sp. mild_001 TaxID=2838238 RepID=UPI001E390DA2|nr:hypothetical protein [Leptospira sp. mild_001]
MNLDRISDVSIAFLSLDKTWGRIYYRYNNPRNSGEDQLLNVSNGIVSECGRKTAHIRHRRNTTKRRIVG